MDERLSQIETQLAEVISELARTQERLRRAERRQRAAGSIWRALGAAMLTISALAATTAWTSASTSVHTAQTPFDVVDSSGRPVLEVKNNGIAVSENGTRFAQMAGGSMGLINSTGKPLVGITDSGNGGLIRVYGAAGSQSEAASISHTAFGVRKGGKVTAAFDATQGGAGAINLFRASGTPSLTLGTGSAEQGFMEIYDNSGNVLEQLEGAKNGGYLGIFNPSGTARAEAGVTSGDLGVVRVFGPGGNNYILGRE